MSADEIAQNLIDYLKSTTSGDVPIAPTDRLLEDGVIDSQGMLGLVTHIEETYDIIVADDDVDLDNFGSVEAIVRYISASRAVQA